MDCKIAVCGNLPELDKGGWSDPAVCAKYPGSGWLREFAALATQNGRTVISGAEAKQAVESGSLQAKQIQVVQEEFNETGEWLISQGSEPALVMTMESPIYTPHFYAAIPTFKKRFKRQMLFGDGTDYMHFPSFDAESVPEVKPWETRRFMVAVVAYKFGAAGRVPGELHSKRMEAMEYFLNKGALDVFGKGWPGPIPSIPDGRKIDTISNYRFALCFENGSYRGYVTEKLFDCLVAGVIPIYWGPPNPEAWLWPASYIDASTFSSWQSLHEYLLAITPGRAAEIIQTGRDFLKSPRGHQHSYQGFAARVLRSLGAAPPALGN